MISQSTNRKNLN